MNSTTATKKTLRDFRPLADLRDPQSFDMAGRDSGPSALVSGAVLAELARDDSRIVLGTADLQYATQMAPFRYEFPERFLQFGISERNMLGAAAGLAASGFIPYVCTFAAFAGILGFENIRTDMAYTQMPVRVLATHAGISMGFFATSHHATEDIAALRSVADLMVLSPADGPSYAAMLRATVDHPGPIYFRLGRGREPQVYDAASAPKAPGAPHRVHHGSDRLLIVATGAMVSPAVEAARLLAQQFGEDIAAVFDVHTLKPFDPSSLIECITARTQVLVVEEHTTEGGLGSIVREALLDHGVPSYVYKHGLYDEYALIGPPQHLYRYYGLDAAGIATVAQRLVESEAVLIPQRSLWTSADRQAVEQSLQARSK